MPLPPLPSLPHVCVCYILRSGADGGREVLLGRKKKGLGLGKIVGPGGKLEPGETPEQAIVREVAEESGLVIAESALTALGRIRYEFPHHPAWSQESWVFSTAEFSGSIVESDELLLEWFPVDRVPLAEMWDDARWWLRAALSGETVGGTYVFGPDLETVQSRLSPTGGTLAV
jgi:8-oxo-dGTP diphosphatase